VAGGLPSLLAERLRPPGRAPGKEDLTGGITITRVFDAPREHVWREWTEPEAFADWFGGPDCEVPLATLSMDVKPGGAWRATMFCDGGRREIQWKGEYQEVVEPERLVFTVSDQPGDEAYELITVVLTERSEDRTEMLFRQTGGLPPEVYEAAEKGWSGFFDRVAERLAPA
jgi:uncharacterized protein YndB with AHSA1/START domain